MSVPYGTLIPNVSWPGITNGVRSFRYDCVHGISPNVALIVTNPQPKPPAGFGNLHWSDGKMGMALSNCKLSRMTPSFGPGGYIFTLEILDRRWQWAHGTFPNGGGKYNQLDPNGKLIPWTIRSPNELALICLQAMGETQFRIEGLPKGLGSRDARRVTKYLETGQNYPLTAANPPVNWEGVPPAVALAELCDRYGCRVIFQPGGDRLLIQRQGVGKPLSSGGSLAQANVSMAAPETPVAVGVYGAASQYQMRLALEPVALEWDGSNHYVPLDLVSYAPMADPVPTKQITTATVLPLADAASTIIDLILEGVKYTGAGVVALFNEILRREVYKAGNVIVTMTAANQLTLTAKQPGVSFSAQGKIYAGTTDRNRFDCRIVQYPATPYPDWSKAAPPYFNGIQATDRLSLAEARDLSRRSVWRAFRVMDEDVEFAHANARLRRQGYSAPYKPIIVPGYGKIRNRRQLAISAFKVDQVVPSPRLAGQLQRAGELAADTLSGGILPEYYNGIARNRVARAYGEYAKQIGSVAWNTQAKLNNDKGTLLKEEFQVDPFAQVIIFAEPIYKLNDQGGQGVFVDPELVLECAVTVCDPVTWSERRPEYTRAIIGGVAPPEYMIAEDVIANFVGEYDERNHLKKVSRPPEDADGPRRAEEYVRSMAAKYQTTAAQTQTWNGVNKIDPDGLVQQVKWEISPAGIYTTAGTNSEFSTYLPGYGTRRQRENLAANPNAALANVKDMFLRGQFPKGGAVAVAETMKVRG